MTFPTDKSDLVDNVDDAMADHINKIEDKIGIDEDTETSSLDYMLRTGWTPARETWTYASATTITVPSGAEDKYQKGDKIRLKQGGDYKYWPIIAVADELLTIAENDDYTLADAEITDNYYSKVENPQGFPNVFYYPPDYSSGGSMDFISTSSAGFVINGQTVSIYFNTVGETTGSGYPIIYATAPEGITSDQTTGTAGWGRETGSNTLVMGIIEKNSNNVVIYNRDISNWDIGEDCRFRFTLTFPLK
jgi:hypothetical protein